MYFEQATFKDVGCFAIPADNSHTMDLTTLRERNLVDKEVQIISRPFKTKIITDNGSVIERTFVIVSYEYNIVRVLNSFKKIDRK